MALFKEKGQPFEAEQWFPEKAHPAVLFEKNGMPYVNSTVMDVLTGSYHVPVQAGDWICTLKNGEIRVIPPENFDKYFEPA